MNKNDILLIISLLIISFIIMFTMNLTTKKGTIATVYYDSKLVKEINLNKNAEYDVKGYNGNIHIIVKDNKIKVEEETSPLHLCSKQGFIQNSTDTIVCLPNKIVIKINTDELDTVI